MARIRTIKPEFFHSERIADLTFQARLLFVGLWTLADRRGRLEDRPKRIKAQLFSYDNLEIDDHLEELRSAGFITRYEADCDEGACKVIQIKNFELHQRISGKESETESLYPPLDRGSNGEALGKQRGSTGEAPGSPGREGKGREGKGKEEGAQRSPLLPQTEPFITLTLNDKSEWPITADQVAEFAKLYPAIDVEQSLRDMRGWCTSNPSRRKTKTGIMRFVNRWLSLDQDNPRKHRVQHDSAHRPSGQTGRHISLEQIKNRDRDFRQRHGLDEGQASPSGLVSETPQRSGNGSGDSSRGSGGGRLVP